MRERQESRLSEALGHAASWNRREYHGDMRYANLIVAQAFESRPEAELAKTALEAAGIPAMVQSDTVGGMREHLAWSGAGFRVLVREEDAADAHEVLTTPAEPPPEQSE